MASAFLWSGFRSSGQMVKTRCTWRPCLEFLVLCRNRRVVLMKDFWLRGRSKLSWSLACARLSPWLLDPVRDPKLVPKDLERLAKMFIHSTGMVLRTIYLGLAVFQLSTPYSHQQQGSCLNSRSSIEKASNHHE